MQGKSSLYNSSPCSGSTGHIMYRMPCDVAAGEGCIELVTATEWVTDTVDTTIINTYFVTQFSDVAITETSVVTETQEVDITNTFLVTVASTVTATSIIFPSPTLVARMGSGSSNSIIAPHPGL